MNRIKILLLICIVSVATFGYAQQKVSDGTAAAVINPNAILDLQSASKGLLLPRVALTSTTVAAPVGTSFTGGMTVYNTNTAGDVTPGYYYSDGSKWVRLASPSDIPSAWNLTGNSGTAPGTNFIGTTDNQDVILKRNSIRAGWINTSLYNTSFGAFSLQTTTTGSGNTAFGYTALSNNTNTNNNTAFGTNAIKLNTGSENTAIGFQTMNVSGTGSYNTAVGSQSLNAVSSGTNNTAIGYLSLNTNNTGTNNTALGDNALVKNTSACFNTAVGSRAMANLLGGNTITAARNTAVGNEALSSNITGNYNVAVGDNASYKTTGTNNVSLGYRALYSNTSGNNNTSLGNVAGQNITTGSNNIAIGNNTDFPTATASNQMNIGNSIFGTEMTGTVSAPAGNIGIDVNNPGSTMTVGGSFAGSFVRLTATSTTLDASNYYVSYDGTANGTFTLPAATAAYPANGNIQGRIYYIKNVSDYNLTINTSGTEKIRNNQVSISTLTLFPGGLIMVVSTGLSGAVDTWQLVLLSQATAFALSGQTSTTVPTAGYNSALPQVISFAVTDIQVSSGSPGTWDDTNNCFIVAQNGYYEVAGMAHFRALGGFETGVGEWHGVNLAVTKNGTAVANLIGGARSNIMEVIASNGNTPLSVRFIVYLKEGDKLYLTMYKGFGDDVISTGSVSLNAPIGMVENRYFNIKKL